MPSKLKVPIDSLFLSVSIIRLDEVWVVVHRIYTKRVAEASDHKAEYYTESYRYYNELFDSFAVE